MTARRRHIVETVLVAVVVALAGLMWRSQTRADLLMFFGPRGTVAIASTRSRILLISSNVKIDNRRPLTFAFGTDWCSAFDDGVGMNDETGMFVHNKADSFLGMAGSKTWVVGAPHWLFAAMAVAQLAWGLRRFSRKNRRRKRGLCIQCGYDLRATPERCPECGLVTKG